MAAQFKTTFRQFLPHGGRTTSGENKQGKQFVVGNVEVTSYNSEGEALSPADMGLGHIDAISFRVKDETDRADGHSRTGIVYTSPAFYLGTFYLYSENGAGVKATPSGNFTVEVIAHGDSAFDVELV